MLSGLDLADLIAYARAHGAKIILAGDLSQLQAVENGGGMSLLATRLGYARLAEPVRFRNPWEQQASLRLRDGDTTVLADYDEHGRIHGGDPEQTMDAAAAAYVALTTSGTDTLLMATDHALRRELNRRIRDDLIALGIVQDGPAVTIADGAQASPGDLIICTRNDHTVEASEPGRTLANGDLLRIEAIIPDGLIVRRALDADPSTGRRRWTDRHFLFNSYENSELGYAVTDHAAQGRTVHTGLAVITGTEDRQHAYVALTRGTDANHAYVFTASPKRADPIPGLRAAPELARYDTISAERADDPAPAIPSATAGTALAVLSAVLERDGQQRSATQALHQALADADHLALLHAIWTAETSPAREQHYRDLLAAALPPGYRAQPGPRDRWLWRTLHAAELAGLDPAQVLADAVAERDLAGARDIPAVIDTRIRNRVGSLVPLSPEPWSARVPAIADPERRGYVAEIAVLMDARKQRLGEHAAACAPPWAVNALGPVPEHQAARLTSLRTATEARAAQLRGDHRQAIRDQERSRSYRALEQAYRQRETVFAAVMADRTEWEAATRQQRHLAVAADAEIRRRHPGQYYAPLRSAEPAPATAAQRAELTVTAGEKTAEMGQWIKDLAAGRRTFADRLANRQSQTIPSEDPDYGDLGPGLPTLAPPCPGARSCSRHCPRFRHPRRSSSTPPTVTPTGKPPTDGNRTGQTRARITASVYCSVVRSSSPIPSSPRTARTSPSAAARSSSSAKVSSSTNVPSISGTVTTVASMSRPFAVKR